MAAVSVLTVWERRAVTAAAHRGAEISQERKCEGGIWLSSILLKLATEEKKHTRLSHTATITRVFLWIFTANHWIFSFLEINLWLCAPSQKLTGTHSEKHHLRSRDNYTICKEQSAAWRFPLNLWDYSRQSRFVLDKSTLGIMSSSGKSILARIISPLEVQDVPIGVRRPRNERRTRTIVAYVPSAGRYYKLETF